jgi:hypothetical protein
MSLSTTDTPRWVVQHIDSLTVRTVKSEAMRYDVRIAVFLEEAVRHYCDYLVKHSGAQYHLMDRSGD